FASPVVGVSGRLVRTRAAVALHGAPEVLVEDLGVIALQAEEAGQQRHVVHLAVRGVGPFEHGGGEGLGVLDVDLVEPGDPGTVVVVPPVAAGPVCHSGAAERADGGRGGAGQGHGQQGAPPGTAPGARLAVGGGLGLFGAGRVVGDVEGQG